MDEEFVAWPFPILKPESTLSSSVAGRVCPPLVRRFSISCCPQLEEADEIDSRSTPSFCLRDRRNGIQ